MSHMYILCDETSFIFQHKCQLEDGTTQKNPSNLERYVISYLGMKSSDLEVRDRASTITILIVRSKIVSITTIKYFTLGYQ